MLIMLLETAVILDLGDLVEFIPVVGSVIATVISAIVGLILGGLIWVAGARSSRQIVTVVIGYIAEAIPFLGALPLNTVMVLLVYAMGNPRVSQALEKAPGLTKKLPATPKS